MADITICESIEELENKMKDWRNMSYHSRVESNKRMYFGNSTSTEHFYEAVKDYASGLQEGANIVYSLLDNPDGLKIEKMDYKAMKEEHLDDYVKYVTDEVYESTDLLQLLIRKADCLSAKDTVHEAVVIGNIADDIDFKIKNGLVDYSDDIPMITPFFTPDEMEAISNHEVDPYEYTFGSNQKELHEKLRNASIEYELSPTEENAKKLIELGWNPSVSYNENTIKFARERIIKWFNENKALQIIDISQMEIVGEASSSEKEDKDIHPVHIVLCRGDTVVSKVIRGWTASEYSHAGLSFDSTLKHIFSYNRRDKENDGFVDESIDQYKKELKNKKGGLEVVTFFVSSKAKAKLQKMIKFFIDNKSKTRYAFDNILRYVTKHAIDTSKSMNMVCSQFVDYTLKSCNIDLTGKPSNLVFPGDFENLSMDSRLFVTFKDKVEKFKPQIITNRVRFLLKRPKENLIVRTALGEHYAIDQFYETRNPYYLFCKTENASVAKVLGEAQKYLFAEAIIVEKGSVPNNRSVKTSNNHKEYSGKLITEFKRSQGS